MPSFSCSRRSHSQVRNSPIDATRMADGKLVYIKRIASSSEELQIALFFSDESRKNDARNHAVPILDAFEDSQDPSASYIVMPLLHRLDEPPFSDVCDVLDFVTQTLEVRIALPSGSLQF